ncbi:MAG: hypothetical protein IAB99_07145 [Bacteroidetes bacterium]|uniref:Uncharacterized protein n=1 Tax=Candidatus Cryptobacteroides faecipullorum TaxID=2840764 RepID=A0A9D9NBN3_9BACT|nr:hypothetical protein [Candidatus Cryptobacteroides faecipullorum]
MLRETKGARRYNDTVTLMRSDASVDEYGHMKLSDPVKVLVCHAYVRQMSLAKTMMTFQQANVVGLDIELRATKDKFNLIEWRGHMVHFPGIEDVDGRGMKIRIQGYYQADKPEAYGGDTA